MIRWWEKHSSINQASPTILGGGFALYWGGGWDQNNNPQPWEVVVEVHLLRRWCQNAAQINYGSARFDLCIDDPTQWIQQQQV